MTQIVWLFIGFVSSVITTAVLRPWLRAVMSGVSLPRGSAARLLVAARRIQRIEARIQLHARTMVDRLAAAGRYAKIVALLGWLSLTGCSDLFYGGETVRVSGTVTLSGAPAVSWEVRLMPAGTRNTSYDSAETDTQGRYRELVVFGQASCAAIRVATRPPEPADGAWTEREVQCGTNRIDFVF